MLAFRSQHLLLALIAVIVPSSAGVAGASKDADDHARVSISEKVVFHPRKRDLAGICRTRRRVVACTMPAAEIFRARCEKQGERWRVRLEADFDLLIHTIDAAPLPHERLHISDMQPLLDKAVERYLAMEFEKGESCSILAKVMANPAFTAEVMNRVREESNLRHGCTRLGSRRSEQRKEERAGLPPAF